MWYWLLGGFLVILFVITKYLKKPEYFDVYPKCDLSPKSVVFAFDFHDVVVHLNPFQLIGLLVSEEGRNMCLTMLKPNIFIGFLHQTFSFLYSHYTGKKGVVVEELFFGLCDQYPELAKYAHFFTKLANSFDIDPVTQQVIEQLKLKGYSVYLFSNIGSRFFDDMKLQYPWLNQLFDGHMCAAKSDGYLKKPNKLYYKLFCERYLSNDKCIIFIDDHVYNLRSAVQSHYGNRFHPIHFTSAVNLRQLLQQWEIL